MWFRDERSFLLGLIYSFIGLQSSIAATLNLSKSCQVEPKFSCSLSNVISTLDDPLLLTNATAAAVMQLIVRNSQLQYLPADMFKQLPNLMELYMHNCGINSLSNKDFQNARRLRVLALQRNRFYELPDRVFAAAIALSRLHLPHNGIKSLHPKAFADLHNLTYLDLQQNSIDELQASHFAVLSQLEHIDLSSNELKRIDDSIFSKNLKLRTIMLANNKFSVFEANSLQHLPHLHLLDISQCEVYELRLQSVDTLLAQNAGLHNLTIYGAAIKIHAGNNQLSTLRLGDELSLRELELHGNQFNSLNEFIHMQNLQHLDVSKNQINNLKSHIPLPLSNLLYLNIAFNQLHQLNDTFFVLLQKLTHLDLAFNHLLQLNESVFEVLTNLEKLYIEGNGLSYFDYEQLLHRHSGLHELGIFENEWNFQYLQNMKAYLKERNVQLPVRFAAGNAKLHHGSSTSAVYASSYNSLKHHRYGSSGSNQQDETEHIPTANSHKISAIANTTTRPIHNVYGIHPYWTRQDYFALFILIIVLVILVLQFLSILKEEGCLHACYRWCSCNRNNNVNILDERQRLEEYDSEV